MERIDDSIIRRGDCEFCPTSMNEASKSVCWIGKNFIDAEPSTEQCQKAIARRAVAEFVGRRKED